MKTLWDFFNEKKTIIGTVFLFAGTFIQEVLVDIWSVQGDWIAPTIKTCAYIGLLFGGVGLVHKGVKSANG